MLAATETDDGSYHLKETIIVLFRNREPKHDFFVDIKALFGTIKTLHQTTDFR